MTSLRAPISMYTSSYLFTISPYAFICFLILCASCLDTFSSCTFVPISKEQRGSFLFCPFKNFAYDRVGIFWCSTHSIRNTSSASASVNFLMFFLYNLVSFVIFPFILSRTGDAFLRVSHFFIILCSFMTVFYTLAWLTSHLCPFLWFFQGIFLLSNVLHTC